MSTFDPKELARLFAFMRSRSPCGREAYDEDDTLGLLWGEVCGADNRAMGRIADSLWPALEHRYRQTRGWALLP